MKLKWNKNKKMKIHAVCLSHIGQIRQKNQDNFCFLNQYLPCHHGNSQILEAEFSADGCHPLIVFDGMGGECLGEEASFLSAEKSQQLSFDENTIEDSIHILNQTVLSACRLNQVSRMGTTVSLLNFSEKDVIIANVGDSPVYVYRNGDLSLISERHVMQAYGQEQKPGLLQYLGMDESECMICPFLGKMKVCPEDIFLICSDGLTDMVDENEICAILNRSDLILSEKISHLLYAALANGGDDNITIILAEV